MTANLRLALTLLAGTALGAAAIQAIHAQARPPVYVVVDIAEVTDSVAFKANNERSTESASALLKDFGGRYVARTDKVSALDGALPARYIIIAFDSPEKAFGWYNSPAEKEVNAVRFKATKSRAFIVEGLPTGTGL